MRHAFTAAILLVASSFAANAETITPANVKVEDAKVMASLTGSGGDALKGREIFANRRLGNCLACHANTDLKDQLFHGNIGPDLTGAASRWEPAQLRAIVINSKSVFGPETVMPAFYGAVQAQRTRKEFDGKTILTAEQVEDVVAYLSTLKE